MSKTNSSARRIKEPFGRYRAGEVVSIIAHVIPDGCMVMDSAGEIATIPERYLEPFLTTEERIMDMYSMDMYHTVVYCFPKQNDSALHFVQGQVVLPCTHHNPYANLIDLPALASQSSEIVYLTQHAIVLDGKYITVHVGQCQQCGKHHLIIEKEQP